MALGLNLMSAPYTKLRPASAPATPEVAAEVLRIAVMNMDALRACWLKKRGGTAPPALTRDLLARSLAHFLQEQRFGGLTPQLRKLLGQIGKDGVAPLRHLKAGSVIVREHDGLVHEVIVVPGGFLWRGETFSSLSTIALKITGTSWNGPRFFGLRTKAQSQAADDPSASKSPSAPEPTVPSPSITKFVRRGGRAI